jgi:hypothetical protein
MSSSVPGFYDDDGNPITADDYFRRQAEQRELRDKVHASMTPDERREWERRYATGTAHVDTPPPVSSPRTNGAKAPRTNGQATRPRERRSTRRVSKATASSGEDPPDPPLPPPLRRFDQERGLKHVSNGVERLLRRLAPGLDDQALEQAARLVITLHEAAAADLEERAA